MRIKRKKVMKIFSVQTISTCIKWSVLFMVHIKQVKLLSAGKFTHANENSKWPINVSIICRLGSECWLVTVRDFCTWSLAEYVRSLFHVNFLRGHSHRDFEIDYIR